MNKRSLIANFVFVVLLFVPAMALTEGGEGSTTSEEKISGLLLSYNPAPAGFLIFRRFLAIV